MSDTPDFTTTAASYSRLVVQGQTPGGNLSVNVPLDPTDKAVVVLLPTNLGATVTVVGVTSGIQYGQVNLTGNQVAAAIPFAVYGALDHAVTVEFTNGPPANTPYAILATDDDMAVAMLNTGLTVRNQIGQSIQASDSDGQTEQATRNIINTVAVQVLPNAVGSKLYVVDTITFFGQSAAVGFTFTLGSSAGQIVAQISLSATSASNPVIHPGWRIQNGLWAAGNAATNVAVCVGYHEVSTPAP